MVKKRGIVYRENGDKMKEKYLDFMELCKRKSSKVKKPKKIRRLYSKDILLPPRKKIDYWFTDLKWVGPSDLEKILNVIKLILIYCML